MIRQANINDSAVLEEVFSILYKPKSKWSKHRISEQIKNKNRLYFLALERDKAVGAFGIKFNPPEAKFGPISVKRKYQGKGIGSELIKFAEEYSKEREINNLWCYSLEIYNAGKFYEKNGWIIGEFIPDFFDGQNCFKYSKKI